LKKEINNNIIKPLLNRKGTLTNAYVR